MKRLILITLSATLILSGCMDRMPQGSPLSKSWKFRSMSRSYERAYANASDPILVDSINRRMELSYLSLYDDNRYIFLGKYFSRQGAWNYNRIDSTITIDSFIDAAAVRFKFIWSDGKSLYMYPIGLGGVKIDGKQNPLYFSYDPHFEEGNVDLLTADRNAWRVKPRHRESPEQIRARVKAHIDFLVEYFQLVQDKERTYFEPVYLQSAVRFCRDGVGVEGEVNLSDKWIDCFYDREDALKGRKILDDAVKSTGKYPDREKTYTDAYLVVVKRMKEYMDKLS